jgi:hypothetical protein
MWEIRETAMDARDVLVDIDRKYTQQLPKTWRESSLPQESVRAAKPSRNERFSNGWHNSWGCLATSQPCRPLGAWIGSTFLSPCKPPALPRLNGQLRLLTSAHGYSFADSCATEACQTARQTRAQAASEGPMA